MVEHKRSLNTILLGHLDCVFARRVRTRRPCCLHARCSESAPGCRAARRLFSSAPRSPERSPERSPIGPRPLARLLQHTHGVRACVVLGRAWSSGQAPRSRALDGAPERQ